MKPATKQNRAHPVLAAVVVVIVAIATFLCMLGPFQQGWNSIANNGTSSGSPTTTHVSPSQPIVSPRPALPKSSPDDLQDN
jgi:hypothetical protein